ncbi:MAG: helix-turn-helix transcriptional regulator [Veillonellales bacterium]
MAYPRNFKRIEEFSKWLRKAIDDAGFPSARQFSLSAGIKESTTSRILNAKTLPDEETIKKMSPALQKPVDEVMLAAGYPVSVSFSADTRQIVVESPEQKKPQDLKKILEQHEIMFDGVPVDEEAKADILHVVEFELYKRAKEMNKRKKAKDGEAK